MDSDGIRFLSRDQLENKYFSAVNELQDQSAKISCLEKYEAKSEILEKKLVDAENEQALNLAQLKEFILWAKSEHVGAFKYGEIEVNFVSSAFVDQSPTEPLKDEVVEAHTDVSEVDDELLYHSSN